jgi:hypothetical protein
MIRSLISVSSITSGVGCVIYNYKPIEIVWDLDKTLIRTIKKERSDFVSNDEIPPHFMIDCNEEKYIRNGYVRPGAILILNFFTLLPGCNQYVFTAATRDYADKVMNNARIKPMIKNSIAREDVDFDSKLVIDRLHIRLQKQYADSQSDLQSNFQYESNVKYWDEYYEEEIAKISDIDDPRLYELAEERFESYNDNKKRHRTLHYFGKDITLLTSNPRAILVDDKTSASQNDQHGILIPKFNINQTDLELFRVGWKLFCCLFTNDISSIIS